MKYSTGKIALSDAQSTQARANTNAANHTIVVADAGTVTIDAKVGDADPVTIGTFAAGAHPILLPGVLSWTLTSTGATTTVITGV